MRISIFGLILCCSVCYGNLLECSEDYMSICNQLKSCDDCIRKHPCCRFCYDKDYGSGNRCSTAKDLQKNNCRKIENNDMSRMSVMLDEDFMDVNDSMAHAVQLKPQRIHLMLRPDKPQNITITYRPARNYPIDLYYLIDLTISMAKLLDTIKDLGTLLTDHMKNITEHYKLGFGSYVDKPVMPYYRTDERHINNPCKGEIVEVCRPGYMFKHHLSVTDDSQSFIDKVKERRISVNLDSPEGGLEALMQILLCQESIGWERNARKFILLATDAPLHFAGEGLLGGAVKRNVEKCLLDSTGNYETVDYDYPSLAEIKSILSEYKTNVIVATTTQSEIFYSKMKELLPHQIYVGFLEDNFSNILKLIEDGYKSLIKRAVMNVGYLNPEDEGLLDIKTIVDCNYNGEYKEDNVCDQVTEGNMINITLQISMKHYMRKKNTSIYVEERNIQDKTIIDIDFIGSYCSCEDDEPMASDTTCVNGEYRCHSCLCYPGWKGDACNEDCTTDVDKCRLTEDGISSVSCFGRGDCVCGACSCDYPYMGHPFCKYRCPVNAQNQICSNHGVCVNDTCICDPHYIHNDCSYSNDTRNCVTPGTNIICNNRGICDNNECKCDEGYHGKFCENCIDCNALCDIFNDGVVAILETEDNSWTVSNLSVKAFRVPYADAGFICNVPYDKNGTRCMVRYNYDVGRQDVNITFNEQCQGIQMSSLQISFITIGITIALGLLVIVAWIVHIRRQDRKEYKIFLENQSRARFSENVNPIYNSPIRKYENIALQPTGQDK